MAKDFDEETKTRIIGEYQKAVAEGKGGGKAVAAKYGLHAAHIIGWAKSRGAAPVSSRTSHAKKHRTAVEPPELVTPLTSSLDLLIRWHALRMEHLQKMREGFAA